MDLKEILAISGQGGLFKYVSDGRNGIIVESFIDKKRSFVPSSSKVSSLEDIAIYTETEEVPLREVLKKIAEKENKGAAINHKSSPDELKKYFTEILPDYDKDRVYVSDIKKVIHWYNLLQQINMLDFDEKKEKEEKEVKKPEAEIKKEKKETQPAHKKTPEKKMATNASPKTKVTKTTTTKNK